MKHGNLGFFALESALVLMEALNKVEIGKVAVAGMKDMNMELALGFEDVYTRDKGAFVLN